MIHLLNIRLLILLLSFGFVFAACGGGEEANAEEKAAAEEEVKPKVIYDLGEVVFNPTGTMGKKLMVVGIAIPVDTEEQKKELEESSIVIKDLVLRTFSKYSFAEINEPWFRDSVKSEIIREIQVAYPEIPIATIYIPKWVIQ